MCVDIFVDIIIDNLREIDTYFLLIGVSAPRTEGVEYLFKLCYNYAGATRETSPPEKEAPPADCQTSRIKPRSRCQPP